MRRKFTPQHKVLDATPQQLVDWAPERGAPVVAGYTVIYAHEKKFGDFSRAVYLYLDGGILSHNPFRLADEQKLSEIIVRELGFRSERLGKAPKRIDKERCPRCREQLRHCRCRIEEKENARSTQ